MTLVRRKFLKMGGGILAAFSTPLPLRARSLEIIEMKGTPRGEQVWFAPQGLAVSVGTTIRFVNRDAGNGHTATTYHPDNFDRIRRIPKAAKPWNSDFLMPNESFEVMLTVPGVYDYYCIPHEMAAMVGRIVVGRPDEKGWEGESANVDDVPPEVLALFPKVDAILDKGRIERVDKS
ncbi:plastocyanin/azurin family copper-binding protein [Ahrensia kielensis]|uniref:Plastocyanin/azurin family copper-binding protein n=1 Tax=Ahrensia kielensis TaxID=76980 RepID=A0ABU9T531_9HYPH